MSDLMTRAEVAAELRISERTLRRLLPKVKGLAPIRAGRNSVLFDADDRHLIREALRWPYTSDAGGRSGTRAAQSALVARRSTSASSAQDRVRELTRKPSRPQRKRASDNPSSTDLPVARAP
jgi:hypothetical protein